MNKMRPGVWLLFELKDGILKSPIIAQVNNCLLSETDLSVSAGAGI